MRRTLLASGLACGLVPPIVALGWGGCFSGKDTATIYIPGDGGDGGTVDGGPGGKGVGEACSADEECRPGLGCDAEAGSCQPAHSTAAGQPCVISAECEAGLYCAGGVCAPAGSGAEGEPCVTDADCESGLRCTLVGFGAQCLPEGDVDVGGACITSADCFGALGCVDGACIVMPPGVPPFGKPWEGVTCEPSEGPVQAYFRVPRGDAEDGDFFRLPFPNDVRLTGGKLDLAGFPTPGDGMLGYDVVQRYVDAVEADNDGWGTYQGVFFRFSGPLTPESLKDHVKVVDLTAGQEKGYFYAYSSGGSKYVCGNLLVVTLPTGSVWEEGKTYAVYLLAGIKDGNGAAVAQPDDLGALLAATAPAEPALAAQYAKYQPFRDYLAAKPLDPSQVLDATVFTIGHPRQSVAQLETVIAAADAPTTSDWTLCDSSVTSPCPDHGGDRGCQAADASYHELHALVELPIFQQGTAPYLTPSDGGDLKTKQTVPEVVRSEQVCLSLTIPKDTMPPGGWPVVVYAHGTGGSFRTHVTDGIAADFAKGVSDGQGNTVKAAVLGIDQVQHGPRRNGSMLSPNDLFFNFANPKAARGNPQQGAADQLSLLRLVPTVTLTASASPTGEAFDLSPTAVGFWGHSQGATEGAIGLPYGALSAVLLSGAGASLKDALTTKHSPVDIAGVVPFVLQDFDAEGKLPYGSRHPVLNLLQLCQDAADPIAYGRLMAAAPPPNVAPRHTLQIYGIGDTYTPSVVQQSYAIAAGLGLVAHDASVSSPEDIGGKTEIPAPASGNLTVNQTTVSAFVRQYAPANGEDGHFVVFDVPAARQDAERFLAGGLAGGLPQVGE